MDAAASNRTVAVLVHYGLSTVGFGIAAETFGPDRPEMKPDWYRFVSFTEQAERPPGRWTVTAMAWHAAMIERSFARHFHAIIGKTPGEWCVALRLDLARNMFGRDKGTIEAVAGAVGFGSTATVRHHFRTRLAVGSAGYRARFSRRV